MTDTCPGGNGIIYPKSCLRASPAYWKWVKLTAADVHALRVERGFEAQKVYFHLNHPIHYVYLCGTVVGCQFVGRFVLVTLDDCSGETIELKLEAASNPQQSVGGWPVAMDLTTNGQESGSAATLPSAPVVASPLARIATNAKNVVLATKCEDKHCHDLHVLVDEQTLEVGMTIVVKGTLELFRKTFQIKVFKLRMVRDVETELRVWREYAAFYQQVLARPWVLHSAKVEECEAKAREQDRIEREKVAAAAEKKRQREEQRAAKRLRWAERVTRDEQRRERHRERAEAKFNGNALDRPRKCASRVPP